MPSVIRIVLVEDKAAIRDLLQAKLTGRAGLAVVAAVGTLAEARAAIARFQPDVLITDLGLPDGTGLALIGDTRQALPATKIAVISVLADEASVVPAIRAGASGYVLKDDLPEDFAQFIFDLVAGRAVLSAGIAHQIVRSLQSAAPAGACTAPAKGAFTPRETQVLAYIAKGLSNADIGTRLGISRHTVGDYVKVIYRKLEVTSRGEAVFQAANLNLAGQ